MEEKLIYDNKFKFRYHTIGLPVVLEDLPREIIFEENTLVLRPEFHVSLVCIGEIIKKHNITIPGFEDIIINDFCEFSQNNNINITYTNEFKFAERDDLKAIITMCKISNLNNFFDLINKKYLLSIEYPPTHITLYTPLSKLGIFLTDSSDINNLTKPISNPIGRLL
jgi:hypothetical protein